MADYPFMPFWTDAYLADTAHLSTEEHGAYLLLLIQAWRSHECSLPDDDAMLARLANLTPAKWKTVKTIVMAFWTYEKRRKRWVQKRLQKERAKVVEKSIKAKDSAASRWKQTNSGDANAMRTQCKTDAKHNHNHNHEKTNVFSKSADAQKKSPKQKLMEAFGDV